MNKEVINKNIDESNTEQALQRLAQYAPNVLPGNEAKSLLALIIKVVSEPMF